MYVMCIRSLVRLAPIRPQLRFGTALIAHHRTGLIPAHICTGTKSTPHPTSATGPRRSLAHMCTATESIPRRHLRHHVIEVCDKARSLRPDMAFGADIIAGFPTETEEMFANTLKIVEECDLTFLHVFPYSEREGTPAARMPQVEPPLRKERAARLRALGEIQLEKFMKGRVGETCQVIVEQNGVGRTPHFAEIHLDFEAQQGELHDVIVQRFENGKLYGGRA